MGLAFFPLPEREPSSAALDSIGVARLSVTVQHLAAPRAHSDGTVPLAQAVLDHPTFMPRLSWKYFPSIPIDNAKVAESIAGAPAGTVFFCDTSAINDQLNPTIMEALLEVPERLALTPLVMAESKDWLGRHPEHPLAQVMRTSETRVLEPKPPADGSTGRRAYDYYVALLRARRRGFMLAEERFRRERGRAPNEHERPAVRDVAHRELGPRGFLLANKGAGTMPTDEALVYLATEFALSTGRPTVILTGDDDVQEQFFKLLWLIDSHYRGMLLADRYATDFTSFRPHPLPPAVASHPDCPFEEGTLLIERGDGDLRHVLPPRAHFVPIAVWTARRDFSMIAFGAEREMFRVLAVKDRTCGLSTGRLGGRNVHPWLAPLPIHGPDRGCAAVARDKRVPVPGSDVRIPAHDLAQALLNMERSARFEGARSGPVRIDSIRGTPTVYGDLIVPRAAQSPRRGRRGRAANGLR